jgi:hypothetical protein
MANKHAAAADASLLLPARHSKRFSGTPGRASGFGPVVPGVGSTHDGGRSGLDDVRAAVGRTTGPG